jgi:hypothetical protein
MTYLGGENKANATQSRAREHSGVLSAIIEAFVTTPAGSLFALVSLLTNLTKSVATLGLEAMLADALTLCLSVVAAVLWTRSLYLKLRQPAPTLVLDASGRPAQVARRGEVALMAALAIIPITLALWTCRPLFQPGLERKPWIFCGMVNACGANACVKLLDSQEREISDCLVAKDDTGYVEFRRPHWYSYRPRTLSAACPGLPTKKLAIPAVMMSPLCGGVLEIP